jgi:hypothetical protein
MTFGNGQLKYQRALGIKLNVAVDVRARALDHHDHPRRHLSCRALPGFVDDGQFVAVCRAGRHWRGVPYDAASVKMTHVAHDVLRRGIRVFSLSTSTLCRGVTG